MVRSSRDDSGLSDVFSPMTGVLGQFFLALRLTWGLT